MFKRILPSAIAISCGLIVLLGLLLPIELLRVASQHLIQWAMILGSFALILAYLNLLSVHLKRLRGGEKGHIASTLIVLSALGGLALVIVFKPSGIWPQYMLQYILVPGETTLLALTAVTLLMASMRILRQRRNPGSVVFVFVVVIALFLAVPYSGIPLNFIEGLKRLLHIPAVAGMRGLLLGIALGTTLTGLRIIFGADRPYSDG